MPQSTPSTARHIGGNRMLLDAPTVLLLCWCCAAAANDCGELANHYGPYDYTNPEHFRTKLGIVQGAHFTPDVEALIRGVTGDIENDIDYTLRTFPNHHRALYSVAKLQLRSGYRRIGHYLTADCYFDRAMRFKPDDGIVRMIYGIYLHKKGRYEDALQRYKEALDLAPEEVELHYNIGLVYADLKRFKDAVPHAQKAYEAGYPLPGLRQRLKNAGVWDQGKTTPDETKRQ